MLPHLEDTIVAPATAVGPGLRAIVRLSGPNALAIARSLFVSGDSPSRGRIQHGSIQLPVFSSALPCDLQYFPGPQSYTGEDVVEIHTLGSPPLVEALIHALLNAGARPALPGEFTLRAFLHGKKDLPQAEAVYSVIEAGSRDELHEALTQLAGGVTQPLQGLRDSLLNLLADLEAGLDFADEDITFVSQREVLLLLAKALAQLTNVQKQLQSRGVSDRPFRVVLIGDPNAGKSSLFNAILDDRAAIISPVPGTTRDYLTRSLTRDGITMELVDTAGSEESREAITEQAQTARREQAERADLILWCVPISDSVDATFPIDERTWLIRTKCDTTNVVEGRATSSHTGIGIASLRDQLFQTARKAVRSAIAPSLSRCRHHVDACLDHLRKVHSMVLFSDPPELTALELRLALDQLGEMVGAIYTDDLLDRIFSRFCIGK